MLMHIYTIMTVPGVEINVSCIIMPVVSPARAATVATHAWTKVHAQVMS